MISSVIFLLPFFFDTILDLQELQEQVKGFLVPLHPGVLKLTSERFLKLGIQVFIVSECAVLMAAVSHLWFYEG